MNSCFCPVFLQSRKRGGGTTSIVDVAALGGDGMLRLNWFASSDREGKEWRELSFSSSYFSSWLVLPPVPAETHPPP